MALAAVVLLAVIAVQRRWNPASLKDVANSAEDFILTTTGIGGQVPDIAGYERLKTFRLGNYRAGLYRATPAPLVFAPGRLVIYDHADQPVFKLETLEGSKDPWSALYDFNGRHGLPVPGAAVTLLLYPRPDRQWCSRYHRGPVFRRRPLLHRGHHSGTRQGCCDARLAASTESMGCPSRAWKFASSARARIGSASPIGRM